MRVTRPTPVPRRRGIDRAAFTRLAAIGACANTAVTSTLIGPSATGLWPAPTTTAGRSLTAP